MRVEHVIVWTVIAVALVLAVLGSLTASRDKRDR